MKISIVTCFHNSVPRLERYFASLSVLDFRRLQVEIILVDNASTDSTAECLRKSTAKLCLPGRIVQEHRLGLMFARCCGVAHTTGDYVVFFDDDNEPRRDFLQNLAVLIQRYPKAVVFTGNAVLPPEYVVPAGLADALFNLAVRRVEGEEVLSLDSLAPQPVPLGAGLVAKRTALALACRAWLESDRMVVGHTGGGSLSAGGEDLWLVHHMTQHGEPIVFSDSLCLVHRVQRNRLSGEYLTRLALEYGAGYPILVEAIRCFKPSVRWLYPKGRLGIVVALARLTIDLARLCGRPSVVNYTFAATRLGIIYGLLNRIVMNSPKRDGE